MTTLNIENLYKYISSKSILHDISLNCDQGEIIAVVGPNGSGKSTLFKIITGLKFATSGRISIFNKPIKHKSNMHKVGALIEAPSFYEHFTGYQNLSFFANDKKTINSLVDELSMSSFINENVKNYSLGMKQRLGLAYVFLNQPDLIILDEPTNGLDIEGIKCFRDKLLRFKETGGTILISSHYMTEIEAICDRVLILKKGKSVYWGNPHLDMALSKDEYCYQLDHPARSLELLTQNFIGLPIEVKENLLLVKTEREKIPEINKLLVSNNISIYEININKVNNSLEDFYFRKLRTEHNEKFN